MREEASLNVGDHVVNRKQDSLWLGMLARNCLSFHFASMEKTPRREPFVSIAFLSWNINGIQGFLLLAGSCLFASMCLRQIMGMFPIFAESSLFLMLMALKEIMPQMRAPMVVIDSAIMMIER